MSQGRSGKVRCTIHVQGKSFTRLIKNVKPKLKTVRIKKSIKSMECSQDVSS